MHGNTWKSTSTRMKYIYVGYSWNSVRTVIMKVFLHGELTLQNSENSTILIFKMVKLDMYSYQHNIISIINKITLNKFSLNNTITKFDLSNDDECCNIIKIISSCNKMSNFPAAVQLQLLEIGTRRYADACHPGGRSTRNFMKSPVKYLSNETDRGM